MKLPLSTVKSILGEGKEEIKEFTDSQLDVLARQYAGLKGKSISVDQANKLRQIFNRIPDRSLDALRRKKIPFLSGLALSRMVQKGMPVRSESLDEKKSAFRLSYSDRFGKHAGFEDAETLADLQNKAANLRKKGFKIDKMGRNTSPIKEKFAVQVTKKDGGKFIHGTYKSKEEAEKFVKWYKTGDLRTTKKIEVVKEMAKDDAYAIGMAQAKKSMKDEPPLEKKTITKGHEIAKKILAKEDYVVKYQHYKTSKMMAAAYKDKKDAEKFRDSVLKQGGKAILTTRAAFGGRVKEDLKEAKYTINYEVESDSGADNRYVGNSEMDVNASSPKDAVKKFGNELNKTVKQAQARGSKSILDVYMNYIEKDGSMISDREVDKLNDYASDLIYKGVYDSYMKEARWQIEGQLGYRGIGSYDGFHMVIDAPNEQAAEQKAYKELDKARDRKKIGPGGGGSVEDVEIENIERTSDRLQAPSTYRVSEYNPAEVKEAKAPFRLSYDDRYGKHAGFEDAKTLADLQNKAANLRKRGFVINKMGRNTSPVKEMRIRPKRIVDHAGARLVFETIKGLKNKAEKSGMPYSILKKVYDRGMAAWRGGHRPGTTQQQWAFARVNSFVTKSSGTWGGADKDLAKQVRGKN